MNISKLTRLTSLGAVTFLSATALSSTPSYAWRNAIELLPLTPQAVGESIQACGQKMSLALYVDDPNEIALQTLLFANLTAQPTSATCVTNPAHPSCAGAYPFVLDIGNSRMIQFTADPSMPNIRTFFATLTNASGDPLTYSKAMELNFTPCQNTTPVPVLLANNGAAVVDMSNRGPSTHALYNEEPVAKWGNHREQLIGDAESPAYMDLSVVTHPKNIERVVFEVTAPNGAKGNITVLESQKRISKELGIEAYEARINAADYAAGTIKVEAIVVPKIGKPVRMGGPLQSISQHETSKHESLVFNNINNGLVTRRTYHIDTTGTDAVGCGTVSNKCRTMDYTMQRHLATVGNNFSGVTLKFYGTGPYVFGTSAGDYGTNYIRTPNGPLIVEGNLTNGQKTVVFNRSMDLTYQGWPSVPFKAISNVYVKNILIRKDNTGPNPSGHVIGVGLTSSPNANLVAENIHFRGRGQFSPDCAMENDPTNFGLVTTWVDSLLENFMGNGNSIFIRTAVFHNGSIAFSNNHKLFNVASKVTQDEACGAHGDQVKSAGGNQIIDGHFVPQIASHSGTQGYYPYDGNGTQNYVVSNAHFRVDGYAAVLRTGLGDNMSIFNSTFTGGQVVIGATQSGNFAAIDATFTNTTGGPINLTNPPAPNTTVFGTPAYYHAPSNYTFIAPNQ